MAYGLPVEGEEGPFAGSDLDEATTCGPDETVEEVRQRLVDVGAERAVVVNDHNAVLGLVQRPDLERSTPDDVVARVMTLSPTTVRPSVLSSSLADADSPVLVTDSEGRLMGEMKAHSASGSEVESEMDQLQGTFLEIAHTVEEHFEGEDPSEVQVRSFLYERLVTEGRTPEEAEAYLSAMDEFFGEAGPS